MEQKQKQGTLTVLSPMLRDLGVGQWRGGKPWAPEADKDKSQVVQSRASDFISLSLNFLLFDFSSLKKNFFLRQGFSE